MLIGSSVLSGAIACKKKKSGPTYTSSVPPQENKQDEGATDSTDGLNPCNMGAALYLAPLKAIDGSKLPVSLSVIDKTYSSKGGGERELLVACQSPASTSDPNYVADFCRLELWTDGHKEKIYANESGSFTDSIPVSVRYRGQRLILEARACVDKRRVLPGKQQCSGTAATENIRLQESPDSTHSDLTSINLKMKSNTMERGKVCDQLSAAAADFFASLKSSKAAYAGLPHSEFLKVLLTQSKYSGQQKNLIGFANLVYLQRHSYRTLCSTEALDQIRDMIRETNDQQQTASATTGSSLRLAEQDPCANQSAGNNDDKDDGKGDDKDDDTDSDMFDDPVDPQTEPANQTVQTTPAIEPSTPAAEPAAVPAATPATNSATPAAAAPAPIATQNIGLDLTVSVIPMADTSRCLGDGTGSAPAAGSAAQFSSCIPLSVRNQEANSRQKFQLEGTGDGLTYSIRQGSLCLAVGESTAAGQPAPVSFISCPDDPTTASSFWLESSSYDGRTYYSLKTYKTDTDKSANPPKASCLRMNGSALMVDYCATEGAWSFRKNNLFTLPMGGGEYPVPLPAIGDGVYVKLRIWGDSKGSQCLSFPLADNKATSGELSTTDCSTDQEAIAFRYDETSAEPYVVLRSKSGDVCLQYDQISSTVSAASCRTENDFESQKFIYKSWRKSSGDVSGNFFYFKTRGEQKCLRFEPKGSGFSSVLDSCQGVEGDFGNMKNYLLSRDSIGRIKVADEKESDPTHAEEFWGKNGRGLFRYGLGSVMVLGGVAALTYGGVDLYSTRKHNKTAEFINGLPNGTLDEATITQLNEGNLTIRQEKEGAFTVLDSRGDSRGKYVKDGNSYKPEGSEDAETTKQEKVEEIEKTIASTKKEILETKREIEDLDDKIKKIEEELEEKKKQITEAEDQLKAAKAANDAPSQLREQNAISALKKEQGSLNADLQQERRSLEDAETKYSDAENRLKSLSDSQKPITFDSDVKTKSLDIKSFNKSGVASLAVGAVSVLLGGMMQSGAFYLTEESSSCAAKKDAFSRFLCQTGEAEKDYIRLRSDYEALKKEQEALISRVQDKN